MAQQILDYYPQFRPTIDPAYWAEIEHFVKQSVFDARPARYDTARNMLTTVTRLTLWCWQTEGLELDREVIFQIDTITRYVNQLPHSQTYGKGTVRSRLLRVAANIVGEQPKSRAYRPYPRSMTPSPYSAADRIELRSLIDGAKTVYQRRNLAVLIALGAGAGVTGGEMLNLAARDLTHSENGWKIRIRTGRERVITVRSDWEDLLDDIEIPASPDACLFLERRNGFDGHRNMLTEFTRRTSRLGIRPETRRLRSTWIVDVLRDGISLHTFMDAAGLTSTNHLERYLEFVEHPDDALGHRMLRGGWQG